MLAQLASPKGADLGRGFRRVGIGKPDPLLTGDAGIAAVAEANRVLGIADALDGAIGPLKERRRGVSAGGLLLSMASAHMTGQDFLVGMDRRRADTAGQQLEPMPTPASTTTAQLAKRFTATHLAGIEVRAAMSRTPSPARRRSAILIRSSSAIFSEGHRSARPQRRAARRGRRRTQHPPPQDPRLANTRRTTHPTCLHMTASRCAANGRYRHVSGSWLRRNSRLIVAGLRTGISVRSGKSGC